MVVVIKIRGKPGYLRQTLHEWLLYIREILENELSEPIEIVIENGEEEWPSLIINNNYIGSGLPGEEGYLIEIIKHAIGFMRSHVSRKLYDSA